MADTPSSLKARLITATRQRAESTVKSQWLYVLSDALEEQKVKRTTEPDFSSHWLHCGSELYSSIRSYYDLAGVDYDPRDPHKTLKTFAEGVIGRDLSRYGLVPKVMIVTNGLESARRIYLLKPGQEPDLNPRR